MEKRVKDLDAGVAMPSSLGAVSSTALSSSMSSASSSSSSAVSRSKSSTLRSELSGPRPAVAAPRPPPSDSGGDVSTQYKFVGESSAIKREMEELTAKAVVLEESLDMIESDWKGKPMDKATLDVVTTLGLERADILRKLESLQRQQRLIELEKERKTRNRIISKTLRAVTSRPSEAPAAPLPDSISNSEELENEVAAAAQAAAASSSPSTTPALDTDDAGDDSDDKSTASTRSRSSRHQRSATKSSRRHSHQVDASAVLAAAADADAHSPKLVRHRVRRSGAAAAAGSAEPPPSSSSSARTAAAAARPVARTSDEEASRPKRTQSTSAAAAVVGSAQTLKSGVAPSIVDRLRAAAAAKELEKKKKLQSSAEAEVVEAPEGFKLDESE